MTQNRLIQSPHNARATVRVAEELLTIGTGATTDTAMDLPAGALILAVGVFVKVAIPTAATFTVIGATTSTAFNEAAVAVAAGSSDRGTKSCPYYNAAAQKVRITPSSSPAAATGRVRVVVTYIDIQAPTH